MLKTEWEIKSNVLQDVGLGNDSKTTTSVCPRKDFVAYPEGVRSAIIASSPTPFNPVSTIKKTLIWWSNIKLLISDLLTELLIEQALNKDILIELLENWDSGDVRIGTLIRLAFIWFATRFKISQLWKARRNYDLNRVNATFFRYSLTVSRLPPDTELARSMNCKTIVCT